MKHIGISLSLLLLFSLLSNRAIANDAKHLIISSEAGDKKARATFLPNSFTAPYSENFDGANPFANAWSKIINISPGGGAERIETTTEQSFSGTKSMEMYNSHGLSGDFMLISPAFTDLETDKRIRFQLFDEDGASDLIIGTMSNPLDASTFTPIRTITPTEMALEAWKSFTIDLSSYSGTDQYIAFKHGLNSTFDNFFIDDFVYEAVPTCEFPTNLNVSNLSRTTVDLNWVSGSSGETEWEVVVQIAGSGTPIGTGTPSNTNTYAASGLTPETNYEFYVRANCGLGDFSIWAGPYSFTTVGCELPTEISATTITDTEASFSWSTSASNESAWEVVVQLAGISAPTGAGTAISTNTYSIMGLSAETAYKFYIRANCGNGSYGDWAVLEFATSCAGIVAPYSENFDTATPPDLNDCWSNTANVGTATTPVVETSSSRAYSAPNSVRLYNDIFTTDLLLVTPFLSDFGNDKRIKFQLYDSEQLSNIIVGTMSNPNQASSFTPFVTIAADANAWGQFTVSFDSYAGNDKYIAFKHGDGSPRDNLYIDDFFYETIPSCEEPQTLTASNITRTAANLSWTSGGNGESTWEIAVQTAGTGVPVGSGITVNSNSYAATGLTINTNYEFYVRANCGGGDLSTWAGPYNFTTLDCAMPTNLIAPDIRINSAQLGWTSGGSGENAWEIVVQTAGTGTPFGGGTATSSNPYLASGLNFNTSYEFYVRANCGDASSAWAGPYTFSTLACTAPSNLTASNITINAAELDWTSNGSAWEIVVQTANMGAPSGAGSTVSSKPYTATGLTINTDYEFYVRVDCGNGNYSAWAGPYAFATSSCLSPHTLNALNISGNTADLAWASSGSGESAWEVIVQAAGTGTPTGAGTATSSNFYAATGLTIDTNYEFYVRANCGGGDLSTWAGPYTFRTLCGTYTAPYSENFDGANPFANCWSKIIDITPASSIAKIDIDNGESFSGTKSMEMYNYRGLSGDFILVSPPFTDIGTDKRISFQLFDDDQDSNLIIGTMSNPSVASTFTAFRTITPAETTYGGWKLFTIDLSNYSGTGQYIAFKHSISTTFDNFFIDDFVYEDIPPPPPCGSISAPTDGAVNQSIVTTKVTWDANPEATGYKLKIGTSTNGDNFLAEIDLGNVLSYTPATHFEYATQYYATLIPYNNNGDAINCNSSSFTTEANLNYGGGDATSSYGNYWWANSTAWAANAPSQPTYNWIDPVANTHTEINTWTEGNDNSGYFTIPDIGFEFPFYGTNFRLNNAHINSNGVIGFTDSPSSELSNPGANNSIPSIAGAENLIAACWMNLDDRDDGKIYYGGDENHFVVTWWHYHDQGDNDEYITFQIILYPNGHIIIQYNDTESTADDGVYTDILGDALVGIENADASKGIQYRNDGLGGFMFGSPLAIIFIPESDEIASIQLSPKAFLQGPLDGTSMNKTVAQNALLPLSDPYGKGVSVGSIPDNVVDWVMVELRDATTPSNVIESRTAFVLDNGNVVDLDGISALTFEAKIGASYHVAIHHRNHLAVMTQQPIRF